MKNLLVAQSGGPTAAINATLAGIVERAFESPEIDRVYGADFGIQGVLQERFLDLTEMIPALVREEFGETEDPETLEAGILRILDRLSTTPAAALGSCRYKLKDPAKDSSEFERLIEIFRAHNIGYFVYIGGNDSMDTVCKLSEFIRARGITDIQVIGAPKTIDNDLFGIDHCPGFGSAAKYIAASMAELERELVVYDTPYVIIVELMGRNAGWLTAAAALAKDQNSRVPYLIYLTEVPFDLTSFIEDVRAELKTDRCVMVAVSEGIRDRSGRMLCEYSSLNETAGKSGYGGAGGLDAFGHKIASGAARVLEHAVQKNIGCKVRAIELNLLQRCAGHLLSETDIRESRELGRQAVSLALAGENGSMSSLRRVESARGYAVEYLPADIREIANREKCVPREWINSEGNGVTEACLHYLRPLVQGELSSDFADGVPRYVLLRKR